MSDRYPGGIISKTAPTPTGPYENGTAPGIWSLEQQMQYQQQGIWPIAGNVPPYIEDVFSTYLYTGNGSTQTITNGIDLSTKGGLVWVKARTNAFADHALSDTANGVGKYISSNSTAAQVTTGNNLSSFNVDGFTVGSRTEFNQNSTTYASWTFRKQPKFFDIVTWTGSNDSGTSIGQGIVPHNLGSAPGCVIIKNVTQGSTNWIVYHRSLSGGYRMLLNTTDAQTNSSSAAYFSKYVSGVGWTQTDPDANNIYVGYNYQTNGNGDTLVAYVFAHNAGGFGLTGTDNVISCGYAAGGTTVNLGYEPQWVLTKNPNSASNWLLVDNMRGMPADGGGPAKGLLPNTSDAESDWGGYVQPTSTGFYNGVNAIYIAIRRGPMKVPTSGTSVFSPLAYSGTGANNSITSAGFPPDMFFSKIRQSDNGYQNMMFDRLRGAGQYLIPTSTDAEGPSSNIQLSFDMSGVTLGAGNNANGSGSTYADYFFKRAPSFFDEVCYTGNGSSQTLNHNLQAVPELMIVKGRSTGGSATQWRVYTAAYGPTYDLRLNANSAVDSPVNDWNSTAPTSTVFSVGSNSSTNQNTWTYVAYLFATCVGVSKVGSYTGNGTTQTINCGFTGGARFVLIKRTDSTGDWYVYDTARGMTVLTDPYLLMNSTAAETATLGSVTTVSTGFAVNASILAAINTNAASYIFLAIA